MARKDLIIYLQIDLAKMMGFVLFRGVGPEDFTILERVSSHGSKVEQILLEIALPIPKMLIYCKLQESRNAGAPFLFSLFYALIVKHKAF